MKMTKSKAKSKAKKYTKAQIVKAAVTGLGEMAVRKAKKRTAKNVITAARKRRAKRAGNP